MRKLTRCLILFFPLVMLSCRTGTIIEETPLGLSETRRNIMIVVGEPKATSENGRELRTKDFDRKWKSLEGIDDPGERFFAQITVLNDRRPYDVQVEVFRQVLSPKGSLSEPVFDQIMSDRLADRIRKQLHQSRDSRNMIDDFKPY